MSEARTVTDEQIRSLRCAICGKPAVCVGLYADHSQEDCTHEGCTQHADNAACDECCGHACEDGSCEPLYDEDGEVNDDCRVRAVVALDGVAS